MTNNPQMPLRPEDPDEVNPDMPLMKDADGDEKLDPDAADELIDSAEADRIAAETESREE